MIKHKYSSGYFAYILVFSIIFMLSACTQKSKTKTQFSHPRLLLSESGIKALRQNIDNPLIKNAYQKIQNQVNRAIVSGIKVPYPNGPGGGYIHEQHKKNGYLLYESGLLYQVTGEKKYAEFARKMFLKYAALYPKLGLHPNHSKKSPGKLFYQALNSSVWLVYAIQGYDFLYNYLSPSDREKIEKGILLPMANFLSAGSPYMFDRIHNHATWAVSAVGMTGYVLDNKDLVEKSLYGLYKDGKGGFIAQINQLFSPDGYYTEGPYYQRYAMMPFMTFADVIDKNEPSRKLFAYRDSVLIKSVNALLQMTDSHGAFFPINDYLTKTFLCPEVVLGVDIAYAHGNKNPELLDIAGRQKIVSLTDEGILTAIDWKNRLQKTFIRHSVFLSDGPHGDKGGLGILRYGMRQNQTTLVMKATSHGMGHGHFDELDMLLYDHGEDIIRDYGSVRYLNIAAKSGGRYLPLNASWAKQTIASNAITVDETSQNNGNLKKASLPQSHSEFLTFSDSTVDFQYMSALDTTAYPGVQINRTMILSKLPSISDPIILDIVNIHSRKKHTYDLPFYYKGKIIQTNFPKNVFTQCLKPLGKKNGYQYLWLNGIGNPQSKNAQITWLENNRFYTLTSLVDANTKILFTTIGANDTGFSLRNEPGLIFREIKADNHLFVNIFEPHGIHNITYEYTKGQTSEIENVSVMKKEKQYITILVKFKNGLEWEYKIPKSLGYKHGLLFQSQILKKKK